MRPLHFVVLKLGVLVATIAGVLTHEIEHTRFKDPSGRYEVIVTARLYHSLIPALPGQGSDKPGFVEVRDASGSLGKAPVEMVSFAHELRWHATTAEIPLACEWDFARREARVLER